MTLMPPPPSGAKLFERADGEDRQNRQQHVPAGHVRHKADGECDGLDDRAHDLDGDEDEGHVPRRAAEEVVQVTAHAVGLDSGVLDEAEADQGERAGDVDVRRRRAVDGHAGPAGQRLQRQQAEQVAEQNEEEQRPQQRHINVGRVAEHGAGDFVPHVEHDRLEEVAAAGRHELLVLAVTLRHRQEDDQHENGRDGHHDDVVADERHLAEMVPVVLNVLGRAGLGEEQWQAGNVDRKCGHVGGGVWGGAEGLVG